jgi:predicted lipid-binding transport protein (Tim44 family)
VSAQICFFFLAAAVAIVIVAVRSNTSWFADLGATGADAGPASDEFASFAPRTAPDEHAGFSAIQRADPDFTVEGFRARVTEMFLALHAAQVAGDLAPTQRFIDPTFYPVLTARLREARSAGAMPKVTGVQDVRPAIARHDDGLDLVRTTIVATCEGGDVLVEYWELIRRTGATSKPKMTIFRCPNCGGPIDGNDPARCAYCDTRLADPALDWVVRKISSG